MDDSRLLLLNSDNVAQRGAAGYGQLTTQFPDAEVIRVLRRDPAGVFGRLGTRLTRVGAASSWYRTSSLKLEWEALRRMRTSPFDLVHVLWGDSDLGHLTRLRPPNTKLVITLHNVLDYLPGNFPQPEVLKKVDGFILMAPDQAEFLDRVGVPEDRWQFIPHGIHADVFSPGARKTLDNKRPLRVVHVGSYLRDFATLAATTRLLENEPVVFDILTSPKVREQHRFSSRVEWHHSISQEELVSLYRNADILLMTATAATANNALLEGLSCGLPVVCQNVSGLTSYLDSDCSEVAVDSSAESLAEIIRRLSANRGRLEAMGEASRRQALALAWEHVAKQTRDFYRNVLG